MRDYYTENENEVMKNSGMEFFHQKTPPLTEATVAHIHSAVEFLYITDGNFKVRCNGIEFTAEKGDVILFRSNSIHSVISGSKEENGYYVLKIKPEFILDISSRQTAGKYALRFSVSGKSSKCIWKNGELSGTEIKDGFEKLICEDKSREGADIAMRIAAATVILGVLREYENKDEEEGGAVISEQIYKSIVYINKNFGQDITAEMLSRILGMSYSYFSRSFKRVIGKSFKEYLNLIRVNRAEQLLMTTDMSVTEVSAKCGYNNVSHFIATYKNIKGKTPMCAKKFSII